METVAQRILEQWAANHEYNPDGSIPAWELLADILRMHNAQSGYNPIVAKVVASIDAQTAA